ncbi:hypothetical protein LCGC14_1807290 [marine sediment metagenome]|uniref:NusB/RsmB/TIM44 domain-containing protein n=1 Tax=marine sediment metagenome TaxID=412755 RepID=A0A0F9HAS4_9ZZZZ
MSGWKRKMARKQMKSGRGSMTRMSRDHQDVLQNIEFALVSTWRHRDDVDDKACHAAIESMLTRRQPRDEAASALSDQLLVVRAERDDVPERLWQDGLRVVADSIRTHSQRRPSEQAYLNFVGQYIPA